MTNILKIPQLSSSTSFALTTNTQWLDIISFTQTGFPAPFSISGCGLISGSGTVTIPTTALLVPGLTISGTPGIPTPTLTPIPFCYVLSITSLAAFTLGDALGNSLLATATNPGAILTFNPPPLDLTGISFISSIAQANVLNPRLLLTAQTLNGTMLNGGKTGVLQYNVPQAAMSQLLPGTYGLDIIAYDGTSTVNLFPQGPATVVVSTGVSSVTQVIVPPAQPTML